MSGSSSIVMSRMSLALKKIGLPPHELRLHRQLLAGQAQRLLGEGLRHAGELEHHAPGLDHDDPALWRALALAHPRLGRLLGERLVGEDVDPHLAAALDLARHRDPGRLDLAVRDPAGLERLDPELAELDRALALRLAAAATAVVLPEGGLLREQHRLASFPARAAVLVLRARAVELRRVLVHRLRRRRVGRLGHGLRRLLDLRLDRRLFAPLCGAGALVGARALDVVLAARAISLPGTSALAAGPPASTAGRAQPVASASGAAAGRPL